MRILLAIVEAPTESKPAWAYMDETTHGEDCTNCRSMARESVISWGTHI